jgi:hypothetical protein
LRSPRAALHDGAAIAPIAQRNHDMAKAKSSTFKGLTNKGAPPASPPAGAKRPTAPPPRLAVRTRASTKGR